MSRTDLQHSDSIEQEDPHNQERKKQKSRRPANTAFRQQRLKAWQPILTPKTVLPILFAVGIIFAPIGGLLIWASASVQELRIDYTDCNTTATNQFTQIPQSKVHSSFKSSNNTVRPQWKRTENTTTPPWSVSIPRTPVCTLQFDIPNDIGPPVYLYYRLTNFYQNHRRYVKSLDTDQLKGHFISNHTIHDSSCNPIKTNHEGKAYYPCGLIANSIFNDTLNSPRLVNAAGNEPAQPYRMTNRSIAWGSDASLYKKTKYTNRDVVPPPNWIERYPDGYTEDNPIPDLSEYEEFQVWMRTAGLPTFSKMALRNDNETMTAGIYQMEIYDFFPVEVYDGTKSILISTRSVVGGKNSFLGIAYVAIGGLCIVLGVLFTVAHLIRPRNLYDNEPLENDLWNSSSVEYRHASQIGRRQALTPLFIVDTYMHIVADNSSATQGSPGYVTDTMIQNQFEYLANAYTNASIGYRLAGVSRVTNDTWASNGDDIAMKSSLRRGTYRSLNIYYQSLLQAGANTPGVPPGSTLLGFCSLPTSGVTESTPVDQYIVDGCNILSGTMPGGNMVNYNLGGTTAHEVGHWNGLLHTFNGNSCSNSDWGDYVADTPQEQTSTSGCPATKDSCPDSGVSSTAYTGLASQGSNPYGPQGFSGVDPIHNFMDYSNDECYQGFTAGQGARMLNVWDIYRAER
ncbi:alkylphosphocholine resistance protein lem3 [Cladophialophora chaetospira]|uniref:Alkylphosphocholine resistance protein lem3 n=1 Tax=Cladophialophora chaetospira TaxID=386627 RepID=A0AA39CDR7_9EURO|nr:alkylphosphocholine resistance protein lem3 [Cladophialophora chaetospira]